MWYNVIQFYKDGNGEDDFDHMHYYIPEDFITPLNLDLLKCSFVREELKLCAECDMDTLCHPCNDATGECYCIALFHDRFKPKWKIKRLV